ncbi:MAG TPA: methionine synthase, partial [Aldersonia sp.]
MTSFAGRATGIGSWPGTDPREAASTVVGEVPDLAHLVELPARGVGADMIGRAGALLVELALDTTTRGYRIAARPGNVARRAHDLLREDLDAFEEAWEVGGRVGDGSTVKVQVAGPLTLASEIELAGGHRLLTDPGAVRDLAASLAEGVAAHVAEMRRRLQADVVVQLDEPAARAVLDGSVRGVTGLDVVRALPAPDALDLLDTVIGGVGAPVAVHCCGSAPPLELFRRSGAVAVGLDVSVLTARDLDGVGELLDSD